MGPDAVGAEVLATEHLREVVHHDHGVSLVRTEVRVPGGPPLVVERTVAASGATRPPVLLVHGLAQNRFTWRVTGRSFVAWLAERGYDVWNVELRGHGRSRALGSGNARDVSEYVDDVVRVVGVCGAPPFAVGHSLGGAVIAAAATRTPLRGLVSIAGVFRFADHNRALHLATRASLRAERLLTLPQVRMSTGWAGRLLAELYQLTDVAGYVLPFAGWVPGSMERELLAERLVRGFDWTSLEVWLQMCRWAGGAPFEWADAFSAVDVPILVVAGDADPLVPPETARAAYDASGSADRTLLVLDAFDHAVHWGHVDLILGRHAPVECWPRVGAWLDAR